MLTELQKRVDEKVRGYGGYWADDQIFGRLVEEVGELARSRRRVASLPHDPERRHNEEEEVFDCIFTLIAYSNLKGYNLTALFEQKFAERDPNEVA